MLEHNINFIETKILVAVDSLNANFADGNWNWSRTRCTKQARYSMQLHITCKPYHTCLTHTQCVDRFWDQWCREHSPPIRRKWCGSEPIVHIIPPHTINPMCTPDNQLIHFRQMQEQQAWWWYRRKYWNIVTALQEQTNFTEDLT